MPIVAPLPHASLRRQQRLVENIRAHRLLSRAILKASDAPAGQARLLDVNTDVATNSAGQQQLAAGRDVLSAAAEGLGLADALLEELTTLAERASDGVPGLQGSFSEGLLRLTALSEDRSPVVRTLLNGAAEPVELADGLSISLLGLTTSALGLSDANLNTPSNAGAAIALLTVAREKILAQINQVDRVDEVLEARDHRLILKAGELAAALARLQSVDGEALLRSEKTLTDRQHRTLEKVGELQKLQKEGLGSLLKPQVPIQKKTEEAEEEEEPKSAAAKAEKNAPLDAAPLRPSVDPLDLAARFLVPTPSKVGSVVNRQG